ncbi:DUF1810 domain-containing protein [Chitinilyticum piscinae]|uniref:DUF1810 domain-containing protein n=1 Tax=Chitinilyticum piscinae TaxID=2866724 RepID=A0A8J7FL55_9NEIS|nr:DUF1810 domain-containing protein [Chitinilyticum piscinae]MBE9608236.1 DUF1810 domain-containing protein [Chitinilyticum piscinae]
MAEYDDLERFVVAQEAYYATALAELRAGKKRSHWMWFVFPQLAGLGRSETARFYALSGREEAQAFLAHPLLGTRLLECTAAVLALPAPDLLQLFGRPDDLKFVSSMTLFAALSPPGSVFGQALQHCRACPDARTLALLA